jgi:hypothetical protein
MRPSAPALVTLPIVLGACLSAPTGLPATDGGGADAGRRADAGSPDAGGPAWPPVDLSLLVTATWEGDVDGDPYADLAIAAITQDPDAGYVYVLNGGPLGIGSVFGTRVDLGGIVPVAITFADVGGDASLDLVVLAIDSTGALGVIEAWIASEPVVYTAERWSREVSEVVPAIDQHQRFARVVDLEGDGLHDFLFYAAGDLFSAEPIARTQVAFDDMDLVRVPGPNTDQYFFGALDAWTAGPAGPGRTLIVADAFAAVAFEGDGSGTFTSAQRHVTTHDVAHAAMDAWDVDGDGADELVGYDYAFCATSPWPIDQSFGWQGPAIVETGQALAVRVAELDGDAAQRGDMVLLEDGGDGSPHRLLVARNLRLQGAPPVFDSATAVVLDLILDDFDGRFLATGHFVRAAPATSTPTARRRSSPSTAPATSAASAWRARSSPASDARRRGRRYRRKSDGRSRSSTK